MNNQSYNLQFEKLCNKLQIGNIVDTPLPISGGLLHKMYSIKTLEGKYAIKALNPQIMFRPIAMENYINSEKIAKIISNNVPALPAKRFNDKFIQEVDNQFYLVFDWIEGRILKANELNIEHSKKIGNILADIHHTNFAEIEIKEHITNDEELIDWNDYVQKGKDENVVWANRLSEIIDKLYYWNEKANESVRSLSSNMVISHRDLDCKNVMWNQGSPTIIDWESAGYINPMHDLIETAIYWSEDVNGNINKEKFLAFINAYKKKHGKLQANWNNVLLNGFSNKLGWLEYNLKRSLSIECADEEEQHLGTSEVMETINLLVGYEGEIAQLEEWLNNEI
ncbi:phosphotransferase [Clostridium sp. D2Q-11]|uniref:Phosphotransferase n=1 Tax=Anaeromonas frigoriresistens TaxID=2683708 RepID=A0A942Z9J1_9FIRM|nr:phosphotransferase [Anaeromonas frigoriresistens]MBS4539378.1 phosphotransferase [Anaeromonas frigoriresistens]